MIKECEKKNTCIIVELLEYLLIVLLVMECNSLYVTSVFCSEEVYSTITIFVIVVSVILLLYNVYINYNYVVNNFILKGTMLLFLEIYLYKFFELNVKVQNILSRNREFIVTFIILLPMYIILFSLMKEQNRFFVFMYKHAELMSVVSYLSLGAFVVLYVNPEVLKFVTIQTRWSDTGVLRNIMNFYNVYCIGDIGGIGNMEISRNVCLFPEPLMFCVQLITALSTELFLRDNVKWNRVFALVVTIFSTQASLALILMVVLICIKILNLYSGKNRNVVISTVSFIGLVLIVLIMKNKMNVYGSGEYSSFAVHIQDYVIAFKAFIKHPFLGVGYDANEYIQQYMSQERFNINSGVSNSVVVILAQGGIVLGIVCMLPLFIGVLQLFNKDDNKIGFWTLGILGLYILTIFHYRYFMIFLFAFLYALVDISISVNNNRKRGLCFEVSVGRNDNKKKRKNNYGRKNLYSFAILGLYFASVIVISYIPQFWGGLYVYFVSHQFFLDESTWRFPLACIVIIFVFVNLKNKKNLIVPCVLTSVITFVLFEISMKIVYSYFHTLLCVINCENDLYESILLCLWFFILYYILFNLCSSLYDLLIHHKTIKSSLVKMCSLSACVIIIFLLTKNILYNVGSSNKYKNMFEDINRIKNFIHGDLYVDDIPVIAKKYLENVKYTQSSQNGYLNYKDANILFRHSIDLKRLFEEGFQVAEISNEYVLYSNDIETIEFLEEMGFEFYRYYPFDKNVDIDKLAALNSIETIEDNQLYITGNNSLKYGPYDDLDESRYEITFCVEMVDYDEGNMPQFLISSEWGKKILAERFLTPDLLDDNHNCDFKIQFDAEDERAVEYKILLSNNSKLKLKKITLKKCNDYTIIRKYDYKERVIYESYYDYLGNSICLDRGYASMKIEYAGERVKYKEYFDENGKLADLEDGFGRIEYVYGNDETILEKYYDNNGFVYSKEIYDARFLDDLEKYMELSDKIVFIAAMDEASAGITQEARKYLKKMKLDIMSDISYRDSYIGIIDNGVVVYEQKDHGNTPIEYSYLNYKVVSAGADSGWQASITDNEVEYAKMQRGFNVVVVDKKTGQVIDSKVYDTCGYKIKPIK